MEVYPPPPRLLFLFHLETSVLIPPGLLDSEENMKLSDEDVFSSLLIRLRTINRNGNRCDVDGYYFNLE